MVDVKKIRKRLRKAQIEYLEIFSEVVGQMGKTNIDKELLFEMSEVTRLLDSIHRGIGKVYDGKRND